MGRHAVSILVPQQQADIIEHYCDQMEGKTSKYLRATFQAESRLEFGA